VKVSSLAYMYAPFIVQA